MQPMLFAVWMKKLKLTLFDKRSEIGHEPCTIPYVLNGFLPSWEDTFVFRQKFYDERNIKVHLNTEVTDIIRRGKAPDSWWRKLPV